MKNPRFWLFVILALLVFSALEIYPPTGRSLIQSFQDKANSQKIDATFKDIVSKAQAMQKTNADPHAEFGQLMTAIGTNDIRDYFYYDVTSEKQPTYAILNRLQRESAGRIKLGLDLQGGFQVLVSLSTNKLEQAETTTNGTVVKISDDQRKMMVDHAVEVLRKRVDKLGVAEPLLQPAGENHILIQLPGLSEAAQREAPTSRTFHPPLP